MGYSKTDLSTLITEANTDWTNMDKQLVDVLLAEIINLQDALDGLDATPAELDAVCDKSAGGVRKVAVGAMTIAADTSAHASTIVIPAGSIIEGVFLDVQTQEATGGTKTVDIGISGGDEDGFLDGVSVAAAGTIKGTLLNTGQTLGALLRQDESGAGVLVPEPYICAAATTLCYTFGSNDFAELVANIVVLYTDIA